MNCSQCGGGPFEPDDVLTIEMQNESFILCGPGRCVTKLFDANDPAKLPRSGATCEACNNNSVVATVTERTRTPLPLCGRCLEAMFFDQAGMR